MAVFVFNDGFFSFADEELSDHVKSAQLTLEGDILDITAMGATSRAKKGGLLDWKVEVEFYADFAASEVYATLFDLVGGDASGDGDTLIFAPTSDAASGTNPHFTGTAILQNFPFGGTVGEVAMQTCVFEGSGDLEADIGA